MIRGLDQISQFGLKVQHISGDEIKLIHYLRERPSMNSYSDAQFDQKYVTTPADTVP